MTDHGSPSVGRLFLYLAVLAGVAGGLNGWIFTTGAIEWSRSLAAPAWAPPGWAFSVIWTVMLLTLGVVLWLNDRCGQSGRRWLAGVFILALIALSIVWVWRYFGLQSVSDGFYFSAMTWAVCALSLGAVGRACRPAGVMLWPLFIWLTYAAALAFETWRLNSGDFPGSGLS